MANVTTDTSDVAYGVVHRECFAPTVSTVPIPTTGQLWPRGNK